MPSGGTTTVLSLLQPALFFAAILIVQTSARNHHIINFRSPNLFPESFTWDPKSQHFIVPSLHHHTFVSVSDAGVTDALISDPSLPPNTSFLGTALDRRRYRLLVAVHSPPSLQYSIGYNALAAYDLRSGTRLFLTLLLDDDENPITTVTAESDEIDPSPHSVANDVAVDYEGNAYVTNSGRNFIWKVNADGEATVFARSKVFKSHSVDRTTPYHYCGINGIVYMPKGYLLVVQSNTGKLFKVDVDHGTARTVILNRELTAGDGIAVRSDGVVVVVSQYKVHFLKSDDSWGEGVVFDETALVAERFATDVVVGDKNRVYVLYGHVDEGISGNGEREEFSIVEIESEEESKEDNVWLFVLIGFGLAYFLFWRFQMRQLVHNMNKKTA